MNSIEFYFEEISAIPIDYFHVNMCIKNLITKELMSVGEISIILCSDKYLLEMNKQYLNHDYYTDIITFDYVEDRVISGDLFISYERIIENARLLDIQIVKELYRVIFHGVLHLVGYKDKSDAEQKMMTEKENYYLSEVDFSGIKL